MEVTLYNFSKRENSTLRPSEGGNVIECFLKENTSKFTPSFVFTLDSMSFTYLKWGSNYYYINDIVSTENGVWQVDCEIDVLATWKEQIKNTSAFVRYSSSVYNTDIPDLRLSTKKNITTKSVSNRINWGGDTYQGYCISYIGEPNLHPYTHLQDSGLVALQKKIQQSEYSEFLSDPQNGLEKVLTDCASCITACRFIPYLVPSGGTDEIVLGGGYHTGISGNRVSRTLTGSVTLSIPWIFSDFRNRSQYTTFVLYLPGYGNVPINADNLNGYDNLDIQASFDTVTADLTYYIPILNAKFDCNVGADVQISTTTQGNLIGGFIGLGQTIGSALSGNNLSTVYGAFNTITSLLETTPSSVGSNGGLSSLNAQGNLVLTAYSHDTTINPYSQLTVQGFPLNAVTSLSTLTGYIECTNASVNCNAPQNLKDKINSYMNGGMYLE